MKTLICFLTASKLLFGSYGYAHAQSNNHDRQAIQMLTEFYTAYSSMDFIHKNYDKLQSLTKKYCTIKLENDARDDFNESGIDDLTHDYGISKNSLKTLKIVKDTKKPNTYNVSYFENEVLGSGADVNEKILLSVTVINENGLLKIANVASLMKD